MVGPEVLPNNPNNEKKIPFRGVCFQCIDSFKCLQIGGKLWDIENWVCQQNMGKYEKIRENIFNVCQHTMVSGHGSLPRHPRVQVKPYIVTVEMGVTYFGRNVLSRNGSLLSKLITDCYSSWSLEVVTQVGLKTKKNSNRLVLAGGHNSMQTH